MPHYPNFTLRGQTAARKTKTLLALFSLGVMSSCLDAANTITWQTSVNMYQGSATDETFVDTSGLPAVALNGSTITTGINTVNGVDFQYAGAGQTVTGSGTESITINGGTNNLSSFGDGEYSGGAIGDLIKGAVYGVSSITLSGLDIGKDYQIQVFNNDARGNRHENYVTGYGDGSNVTTPVAFSQLNNSPTNGAAPVLPETDAGDSIIGTFTADTTSLTFNIFGSLDGLAGTFTQGDGRSQINACQLRILNDPYIGWHIEAEDFDSQSGTQLENSSDENGGQNVSYISNGDWLRYNDVTLGDNALLNFRVARPDGGDDGHIEVRLGSTTGTLIAQIDVPETGGWQSWETLSIPVAPVVGQQDIYLVFVETNTTNNGSIFNLNWWSKTAMVEAEDFDTGAGYKFETTQDVGGGQNLGWISDGEWMEYTIHVEEAGSHRIDFRVAANNSDGSIDIVSGGQTLGSVDIGHTGGWQAWSTVSTYIDLPNTGAQTLRLEFVIPSAGYNLNWFSYEREEAPIPLSLIIGNTEQQKMRYGMDYERLWYWSSNLNGSERDDIARWSAVDADIDFVRVAINSAYELTEGSYNLSAYTSKIIPLMQEMQQANPNIKFFASPRPLNEAVSGAAWQPYPRWVTGDDGSGNFNFDWTNCAEYLEDYLILMDSYGFKISFLDITNEWQSNDGGTRITQADVRDIYEYLRDSTALSVANIDLPEIVAPSSWNYTQGTSWINNLDTQRRRDAVQIAASHNTDRAGDAQSFADAVKNTLGPDTEIWNTETHGWKSTSNSNETTSFYYYLEAIRAGFGGINGWLAIGTTNQGHAYILNPSGTPTRNVKYHIYQKLSSTSNYGHALDIIEEPGLDVFNAPLGSNDDDIPRNVAAFIKGNLMTVWVVNENADPVYLEITPSGYTIATSTVRRTHWIDPSDVEGFETTESVNSNTSFVSTIPGESVCCFEIVLNTETFATQRIEAEDFSHQWGTNTENHTTYENLGSIEDGDWTRYGSVALAEDSTLSFSVARPSGRPDGYIEIREGSRDGPILSQVDVPVTGNWQSYQTIRTKLDVDAGIYNLYLCFVEDVTTTGSAFVNFEWFEVQVPETPVNFGGSNATASQIDLSWDAIPGAIGYTVKRSTIQDGPYSVIDDTITGTSYSDITASAGTTYYYVVVARFDGFEGEQSAEIAATALTPAGAWRQENFGDPANSGNGADTANPDSDSLDNLLEFAFGTDPNLSDSNKMAVNEVDGTFTFIPGTPTVEVEFDPLSVTARFIRRVDHANSGITYTAQFSHDLTASWEDIDGSLAVQIPGVSDANGYEAVELNYPTFLSNGRKARFFRVKIDETASGDTQPE